MKITVATLIWEDACIYGSHPQDKVDVENYGLMVGVTSGLLVSEDKTKIVLAMDSFPEHNTFRTVQAYPKSGIKQIFRKTYEFKSQPK